MKKSVQQLMDETMCRPGYRWNETLKRCLAMGGGNGEEKSPEESIAPEPAAPAKPAKGGRGEVRVNSNGVKQTGTSMGKAVSIK
jgi:hypothetical protein